MLRRMRPRVVLVSVGRGNRFGHPSPVVLERIRRCGGLLRRTDRDGTIAVEWRDGAWRVRTGPP
jgi:competence protein ComEC